MNQLNEKQLSVYDKYSTTIGIFKMIFKKVNATKFCTNPKLIFLFHFSKKLLVNLS